MSTRRSPGLCFVGPAPEVLTGIREDMANRGFGVHDRLLGGVAAALVAEPTGAPAMNEGIFYPQDLLPMGLAGLAPSRAVRSRPTTGTLRLMVLLVDFADNPGTRDPNEFRDMMFSQGTYPTGSMRDFYAETSYGQLDVNGEIIGWLRLPEAYSFYVNGENGGSASAYPRNAQKMVEDALALAAQQHDFHGFDSDGDGYVDGLFLVHAGAGAEADPNPATRAEKIWSHQWNLGQPFVSNGITAYAYCTVPEDGRIGVFSHEFGHMLGLPDLYDTTYQSEGVGSWCVMGGGSWNNGGLTPCHFCAWAKARLGWINPTVVRRTRNLTLPPAQGNRNATYRLWSRGRAGSEYFLIENRQRLGFDSALPSDGLLVWHIDDSEHNNDHSGDYMVGLRQADGLLDLEMGRNRGDAGDPFPGQAPNTRFDDRSNPPAVDQFGRRTGVEVTAIAVSNGAVTCRVKV